MENHPIPQDVTGFKFKLIGSITVKQFLYLLGFGILATVAFILPANFILVRVPLMLLFGGIGASLAFVPIEGRPMDVMIVNFARTIPAENRFIFRKRGANLASFKVFDQPEVHHVQTHTEKVQVQRDTATDKRAILISRLRNSSFRPDAGEVDHLKDIDSIFESTKTTHVGTPVIAKPIEKVETKPVPPIVSADRAPMTETPSTPQVNTPTERGIAPAPSAGFSSIPDVANIILGRIMDPRQKPLANILVEILDKDNVPVRAFKTNAKGQFAAATPLPNGTYKIMLEDGQKTHEFEIKEFTLSGDIVIPIEITSIDAREKLRRELFEGNNAQVS